MKTYELLRDYPAVLEHYRNHFKYILVDEYQDTNSLQYRLIRLLADEHQNICVVGDEDQSIYSWRGADINNILSFEKDFPSAKIIKLEQNYRSSKTIITAASAVIKNNTQRKDKTLFTDNPDGDAIVVREENNEYDEARFVTNEISKMIREQGASPEEFAIFYRTNAQSRVLEEQFTLRSIPFKLVGGMRFYERLEVKDIIAYLKLILNPMDDISFKRVINVPARGIGKTSIDKIEELAGSRNMSMIEAAAMIVETNGMQREFNSGLVSKLRGFINLFEQLRSDATQISLPELSLAVVDRTEYAKRLQIENTPEAEARLENLEELQNAITQFAEERGEEGHLQSFLEEMALVSSQDEEGPESKSQVTLMTLHISKGLEFPYVFIIGCEEGLFPSGRATDSNDPTEIEEERRLCYVGMTRAEQKLWMTHARTRKVWGQDQMNPPSRFLKEIPKDLMLLSSSVAQRPRFLERHSLGSGFNGNPRGPGYKKEVFPDYEMAQDQFASDSETTSYQKGQRVRHPSYGTGQIIAIEGSGADLKVTVVFADQTLKKFVAKYARLERP